MISAAPPPDERERLAVLRELGVLDTPETASFDEIAKLAAHVAGVPIALVSLVDESRQWFKAHHGLAARETPRELAFCAHAILDPENVFVVENALVDERFADNPLAVGEPHVVFYAGAPLVVDDQAVGTLCLIDHTPRKLSDQAREALEILARQVEAQLVLGRSLREKNEAIVHLVSAQSEAARLARLVDLMRRGVIVYGRESARAPFRVVSANAAAIRSPSHPDNVRIGTLASEAKPPEIAAQLVATLEAAVGPNAEDGRPTRTTHAMQGRTFEVDIVALGPNMVAIIADDITARVGFERSKDEFLAIAAHELRTPLAGMVGAMGLLSSGALGDLSPEAMEAVSIAETSALRLTRLTTDMLDLETMRQGRLKLRRAPTTVGEIVGLVLPPLRPAAERADVELVARGALDTPLDVDRDRIVQVLTNFVANAIRYAPKGTQVVVTVEAGIGGARIVVEDAGRGISRANQLRLFGRFVQLEPPERRPHEGTGLGLAIAKALVEMHGGRVGVESEPDVRPGTRFWVELPAG
jgi:signal transduction histidine kinase